MKSNIIVAIVVGVINVTAIIGFVYLAMHFGHWWISLFSLLFLFGTSTREEEHE